MSLRVHRTEYKLNAHEKYGSLQPGWVIVSSVTLTYAYTRPYSRTGISPEENMNVWRDEDGVEYMEFTKLNAPSEFMRSDGDGPWSTLRAGFNYYKDGKPYVRVAA